jgi:hypothetical protein
VGVTCAGGRPAELSGAELHGIVGAARGPWLASGEWWTPHAWAVETWQVEMTGGGLYQLARTDATWRVEGMLD